MLKQQYISFITAIGSLLLLGCNSQSFTLTNQMDIAREDEIVTVPVKDILDLVEPDKIENVFIRQENQKEYLVSQKVDNDLDGDIDEILFRTSIGAGETLKFTIETIENPPKSIQKLDLTTFSRFVPERNNDYAWENDRVAFRIYGTQNIDNKQPGGGIDAFLKRVNYPIINKWYQNNAEKEGAYHIDTGEGYDPYQVGASRGIGGIGIWDNDSLYVSSSFINSRTIAEGPLRTIFELTYTPWDANGRMIKETKRISLDLGSHLSRIEETVSSCQPIPLVAAGITLHDKKGEVKTNDKEGWFRYWEPMDDSWLGTAIVMDPSIISGFKDYRTDARDQSHLFVFTKPVENKVVFYAGFAWQKSGHFKTADEWDAYLSNFSKRLGSPLILKFN